MKNSLLVAMTLLVPAWAGDAPNPQLSCDPSGFRIAGMVSVCTTTETSTSFSGALTVTTPVGGISIVGWDQPDVLVRARIEAAAPSLVQAEELASRIQVNVAGDQVMASGPSQRGQNWSVTFEIFVPRAADLSLNTKLGGISITDVSGTIRFTAALGGVTLVRLAGDVAGSTGLGGISCVLDGDHWEGEGLAVKTGEGGIEFQAAANYSAHFVLSTGLGKIDASYLGGTVAPTNGFHLANELTFDAGSGGATIAAQTQLGGIAIRGN